MRSVMSMIRCEGFTRPGQVKPYQLTARKVVFDDIPIDWATTERWTCWIFFSDCFLSWLFLNSLFSVYVFTWVSVQICTWGLGFKSGVFLNNCSPLLPPGGRHFLLNLELVSWAGLSNLEIPFPPSQHLHCRCVPPCPTSHLGSEV